MIYIYIHISDTVDMFSPSHFSAPLQVQLPAIHAPCLRFAGNSARLTLRADDREGAQRRWRKWGDGKHGKITGKPWENHENIVKLLGKPWENHGKFMDLIMTNTWIPFNKMAWDLMDFNYPKTGMIPSGNLLQFPLERSIMFDS